MGRRTMSCFSSRRTADSKCSSSSGTRAHLWTSQMWGHFSLPLREASAHSQAWDTPRGGAGRLRRVRFADGRDGVELPPELRRGHDLGSLVVGGLVELRLEAVESLL